MVGGDDDGVLAADNFFRPRLGFRSLPLGMLAGGADFQNVGVVVGDIGTEIGKAIKQFEGGRLAHVINVGFVGETKQENAAAFYGFPAGR